MLRLNQIGTMSNANITARETIPNTALALTSKLAALAREVEPLLSIVGQLTERLEPLAQSLAPIVEATARVQATWNAAESLLERGWVPNHTTPFDLVAECGGDHTRLQELLHSYYTDNWGTIRERLEARLTSYEVSAEAKATFREALDAHEAGLYRSVTRVLFPEFESVFRALLFDGRAGQMPYGAFVKELSGEAANMDIGDFLIAGFQDIVLFKYLTEGHRDSRASGDAALRYVPGLAIGVDETNVDRARQSPIPTRHAVVHGLAAYSTKQSSLNAIFIADYVFSVVSRAYARRDFKVGEERSEMAINAS